MGAKLTKEERRRIRELDRSVVGLSGLTASSMQITGIQSEDGVFELTDSRFVKVYAVPNNMGNITDITDKRRCRLTVIHRKTGIMKLLTVFYTGDYYSDVHDTIVEEEDKLKLKGYNPLSVDDVLFFMKMAGDGTPKMFKHENITKKTDDWKRILFGGDRKETAGILKGENDAILPLTLIRLADDADSLVNADNEYVLSVDICHLPDDISERYKKMIDQKYNYSSEGKVKDYAISCFLCLTGNDPVNLKNNNKGAIFGVVGDKANEAWLTTETLGMYNYESYILAEGDVLNKVL